MTSPQSRFDAAQPPDVRRGFAPPEEAYSCAANGGAKPRRTSVGEAERNSLCGTQCFKQTQIVNTDGTNMLRKLEIPLVLLSLVAGAAFLTKMCYLSLAFNT